MDIDQSEPILDQQLAGSSTDQKCVNQIAVNINNLSSELILIILDNFDLAEIKNLRLISKYWRNCIDYLLIKELVVYNNFNFESFNCWSFTYQKIKPKYCLQFNTHRRFFDCSLFTFKTLKKLKINSVISKCQFKFKDLNGFDRLEHLDLNLCCFETDDEHLNLPELRLFSLHTYYYIDLICNTPKLEMFKTNQPFSQISFEPICTGLKHLEVCFYDKNVADFKNLVTLKLIKSYPIDQKILQLLPNLEKLYLNNSIDDQSLKEIHHQYELIQVIVEHLHLEKLRSNRKNLKIYILGILFTGYRPFSDYNFKQNHLALHFKYYDELSDTLEFYDKFDYNVLIESLALVSNTTYLPANFFNKFLNIQTITTTEAIQNQNLFFEFLSYCKNLNELKILIFQNLNTDYYDQLLSKCSSTLNKLVILKSQTTFSLPTANLKLDLTNLKLLRCFRTHLNLQIDCVLAMYKNLAFFNTISFKNGGNQVNIQKSEKGFFFNAMKEEMGRSVKPSTVKHSNLNYVQLSQVCNNLERSILI